MIDMQGYLFQNPLAEKAYTMGSCLMQAAGQANASFGGGKHSA